MRIIHTADWHLGKTLKSQPLLDDQSYILAEFLKLIDDTNPDAVIIAGDVYDRSVPPVDAVGLFDEIIFKLTARKIPVLSISGNHDSAGRLNFGSRLFERAGFFINVDAPVILSDEFGEVYFSLIPYFTAAEIKNKFALDAENFDTGAATKICVENARQKIPAGKRSVAVAHLFATGGVTSESERKNVGTIESVDAKIFAGYNYTALGHLHKPQTMKKTGHVVRYSGSLLKYSFDEAGYSKGVTLVEIDGAGKVSAEHIPLTPRHDVKIVEGTLDELNQSARTEDYVHASLTNKNHVLYAMEKLRSGAFPNILSLNFVNLERTGESRTARAKRTAGISTLEYFADFFEHETGEKLEGEYRRAMADFLDELDGGDFDG